MSFRGFRISWSNNKARIYIDDDDTKGVDVSIVDGKARVTITDDGIPPDSFRWYVKKVGTYAHVTFRNTRQALAYLTGKGGHTFRAFVQGKGTMWLKGFLRGRNPKVNSAYTRGTGGKIHPAYDRGKGGHTHPAVIVGVIVGPGIETGCQYPIVSDLVYGDICALEDGAAKNATGINGIATLISSSTGSSAKTCTVIHHGNYIYMVRRIYAGTYIIEYNTLTTAESAIALGECIGAQVTLCLADERVIVALDTGMAGESSTTNNTIYRVDFTNGDCEAVLTVPVGNIDIGEEHLFSVAAVNGQVVAFATFYIHYWSEDPEGWRYASSIVVYSSSGSAFERYIEEVASTWGYFPPIHFAWSHYIVAGQWIIANTMFGIPYDVPDESYTRRVWNWNTDTSELSVGWEYDQGSTADLNWYFGPNSSNYFSNAPYGTITDFAAQLWEYEPDIHDSWLRFSSYPTTNTDIHIFQGRSTSWYWYDGDVYDASTLDMLFSYDFPFANRSTQNVCQTLDDGDGTSGPLIWYWDTQHLMAVDSSGEVIYDFYIPLTVTGYVQILHLGNMLMLAFNNTAGVQYYLVT